MPMRIALALLITLFITTFPLHAQETTPDTETFTTDDGLLTFEYPKDWFVEKRFYPFTHTIVITNQEEMLPMRNTDLLETGEAQILIQVIALEDMEPLGISEDMSIEEIGNVSNRVLSQLGSDISYQFIEFQHPIYDAASTYISQAHLDNYGVIMRGNGILIQVSVFAVPGEIQPYQEILDGIATSIVYSGIPEDVSFQNIEPTEEESAAYFDALFESREENNITFDIATPTSNLITFTDTSFDVANGILSISYPTSWAVDSSEGQVNIDNNLDTSVILSIWRYDEFSNIVEAESAVTLAEAIRIGKQWELSGSTSFPAERLSTERDAAIYKVETVFENFTDVNHFIVVPLNETYFLYVWVRGNYSENESVILHIIDSIEFTETEAQD